MTHLLTVRSGYYGIKRSSSACLHFVRNRDVDDTLQEVVRNLKPLGIACAYVDYEAVQDAGQFIADRIAEPLDLEHRPYGRGWWVPWLDDLISASERENGVVIVIDNADLMFSSARDDAFDLIESFLIQFHHWLEKSKPCHLCFQMERNSLIRRVFEPLNGRAGRSGA